jgi:hypothetical protein
VIEAKRMTAQSSVANGPIWTLAYGIARALLLLALLLGATSSLAIASGRASVILMRASDWPSMIGLAGLPLGYAAAWFLYLRSIPNLAARRCADLFALTVAVGAQFYGSALIPMGIT